LLCEEAGEAKVGFDCSELWGGRAVDGSSQTTLELPGGVMNEGVHCASCRGWCARHGP